MISAWPVLNLLFRQQEDDRRRMREQEDSHAAILRELGGSKAMSRRQALGLAGATAAVAVVGKHLPAQEVTTYPVSTSGASMVVDYMPRSISASA